MRPIKRTVSPPDHCRRTAVIACALLAAWLAASASTAGAPAPPPVRSLTDVFVGGEEGYRFYRIPALAVTSRGTLLAFCEGRKTSEADHGDIDLVLKRSADGGATWSPLQVVHEEGGRDPVTIGNPCVIATPDGVVHLLCCQNNQRAFYLKSTDDGRTFSPPREITETFHAFRFPWARLATGPGHGLFTSGGQLVAPIWLNRRIGQSYRAGVIVSEDGGQTWKAGGLVAGSDQTLNECSVAETSGGGLVLSARSRTPYRTTAWSEDGGRTWTRVRRESQPATVCQGSLLRLPGESVRWLFSLPGGPDRQNVTVWSGERDGEEWTPLRLLGLGPGGYSDLAALPDGQVACLFERGEKRYHERLALAVFNAPAELRLKRESFDRDPGWDGHNHRPRGEPRELRQDFGYSATSHAGGGKGEVGGFITPAGEPAYYGQPIPPLTLKQPFSASGRLAVDEGAGNSLLGFFNAGTINEWRTPNSLAFRINGRGAGFHPHVEYCTATWRAGGYFYSIKNPETGKADVREFPSGKRVYTWSLAYDPAGAEGRGRITATLNGETLHLDLDPGHRADGATFNRFGFLNVNKSADSGGSLWIDDLVLNGVRETFDRDPGWEGHRNRLVYRTQNIRPVFDFGYSPTRHAGGKAVGELGGLVFRGDERYPERMAYYGDRTGDLSLEQPLKASGKIALRRGVTDSTVLFGFFHSQGSMQQSQAQRAGFPENFLGTVVEGPSSEGFYLYPAYGLDRDSEYRDGVHSRAPDSVLPHIYPDGVTHDWSLEYVPTPDGGGRITVSLDGTRTYLDLTPEHRKIGAKFDRFGIVTTHIDGNGQQVYWDDLAYTVRK